MQSHCAAAVKKKCDGQSHGEVKAEKVVFFAYGVIL